MKTRIVAALELAPSHISTQSLMKITNTSAKNLAGAITGLRKDGYIIESIGRMVLGERSVKYRLICKPAGGGALKAAIELKEQHPYRYAWMLPMRVA